MRLYVAEHPAAVALGVPMGSPVALADAVVDGLAASDGPTFDEEVALGDRVGEVPPVMR